MAGGLVRGVKGREGYLYSDGIYWVLCLFWLNLDKGVPCPMAISRIEVEDSCKIKRYSPQWDNLDLCTDTPHRAGPENLNNLWGQVMVARGPLVGVSV
jgi:hypothetical protein